MNSLDLLFSPGARVNYGGNAFVNVPIILQVDATPIVEVVQTQPLAQTTQFSIYGPDGVYLAKAIGARLVLTPDGEKSNLKLRHPPGMTICELGGKPLFEVKRSGPAALSISAELFSPSGLFVKSNATVPFATFDKTGTEIGGNFFLGNVISNCRIGFLLGGDGSLRIACS